jgi:UDP-N-acetylglucosamine 2-epimerase (hydrolysing)
MNSRRIVFLTGTRADFGKMKSLMTAVEKHPNFENHIFITGMHTLQRYGFTAQEVIKSGFSNIYTSMNQHSGDPMEMILASTITGLSRYIHEIKPDLLVIHGDRVEALAGAIVGALTNTKVCHIEGGERSGTIDESIRHSVSKLSNIHLVCNIEAKNRLIQMGETKNLIFNIGSPDIDLMISKDLPTITKVKTHYQIPFETYSVLMFHPVTTDLKNLKDNIKIIIDAVLASNLNYVVIYPNNDEGNEIILEEYKRFDKIDRIKVFPSIQFESFLTLIKHSQCMVGNSSAGIRETPFYGLPSVNIGDRQNNRYNAKSILNVSYSYLEILKAIQSACSREKEVKDSYFGHGRSTEQFIDILEGQKIWNENQQKVFHDIAFERNINITKGI